MGRIEKKNIIFLMVFLFSCFLINIISMPRSLYNVDSESVRLTSRYLVQKGELGIPIYPDVLGYKRGQFTGIHGKFFIRNRGDQRFYPKWGLLTILLFTIPEFFYTKVNFLDTESRVFGINVFHSLLSCLLAFLLFRIAGLYTQHVHLGLFYSFICMYTTFLWFYMRTQSYEIFQILFFLAFFYHFILFLRNYKIKRHFYLGNLFLSLLVLIKDFYLILYPVVGLFFLIHLFYGNEKKLFRQMLSDNNLIIFMTFCGFTIASNIIINTYLYGQPLFAAKASHEPDNPSVIIFSTSYIIPRMKDYFFSTNKGFLTHFPPLVFALMGFRAFFKNHTKESFFILLTFFCAAIPLFQFYATGEWCYGPRYFLFILPLLSLPILGFMEKSFFERKKIFLIVMAITCTFSLRSQLIVNSYPFFFKFHLENEYRYSHRQQLTGQSGQTKHSDHQETYFDHHHFSIVYQDFKYRREIFSGKWIQPLNEISFLNYYFF